MLENGCHDQTSTDLVSHSFSLLSCFGVTTCFYVEWLMLALKGLGCISLCVHVCGYVRLSACTRTNAVHDQWARRGSTRLHEDESVSWSAKTKTPPHTHTSSQSMQMFWFVIVHRVYCVSQRFSANSCACEDARMRVTVWRGGWRWDWWVQLAENNNSHCVPVLYWKSREMVFVCPVMMKRGERTVGII